MTSQERDQVGADMELEVFVQSQGEMLDRMHAIHALKLKQDACAHHLVMDGRCLKCGKRT